MAAGAGDGAPGPGGPAAPAGGGAVITERRAAEAPKALKRALKVLASGGVVAFPTDTVYGLGAPAFKVESIERLYAIKGRQQTKAIAVLIAEPGDLGKVAKEPSEQAVRLAPRFWPEAPMRAAPLRCWCNWAGASSWCWTAGRPPATGPPRWWN